jgi:hypothetical protein
MRTRMGVALGLVALFGIGCATVPAAHQVTVSAGQVVEDVNFGNRVPNEIVVTTLEDTVDSGDGLISLREAILLANSTTEDVTIVLPTGTYTLTLAGLGNDDAALGDLDVLPGGSVTIVGDGAGIIKRIMNAVFLPFRQPHNQGIIKPVLLIVTPLLKIGMPEAFHREGYGTDDPAQFLISLCKCLNKPRYRMLRFRSCIPNAFTHCRKPFPERWQLNMLHLVPGGHHTA